MYFDNCTSIDEARRTYRRLAKIHHPDIGGDTATMAAINSEYDLFTVRHKSYDFNRSTTDTQARQEKAKKARKPRKKTYYTQEAVYQYMADSLAYKGSQVWKSPDGMTIVIQNIYLKTVVARYAKRDSYGNILWTVRKYNKTPEKYAKYF